MSGGWQRSPLLHFLLLGALLFLVAQRRRGRPDGPTPVAPPADEELLFRAAIDHGFDRDAAVRTRLARLARFVGEDAADEVRLERAARTLGLERGDLVIRRHLVQMMELATAHVAPSELPTETDLQQYLTTHAEAFMAPAEVTFTQRFLRRDRDAARVAVLGRALAECHDPSGCGAEAGDAFLFGERVGPVSIDEVSRLLGPELARAVAAAPVGTWVGPVQSSYGHHVVWVRDRTVPSVPALEAVHGRVLHAWLRERGERNARVRLDAMRAQAAGPSS